MSRTRWDRLAVQLGVAIALLPAAFGGAAVSGCGGEDKSVSAQDRRALDDFSQAARNWKRKGTDPWYAAFKQGASQLASTAPVAEARMAEAVAQMQRATDQIKEPKVHHALGSLTASYRSKLGTIRRIDSNLGSMAAIRSGLAGLQSDGTATKAAWDAWIAAAKRQWNSNPLAGLKIG